MESDENVESKKKEKCSRFSIDIGMLPCKLTYIFWGGVIGTNSPFLNPFFVSIGLTTTQAGFMTGMRLVATLIANPFWGFLADYSGRRRLVIFLLCLGSILFVFPIPWIVSFIQQNSPILNSTCVVNQTIQSLTQTDECIKRDNTLLFYVLTFVLAGGAFFVVPLPGYMDTIAMAVVKTRKNGATYGGQRIFGSIGYCIFHYLAALAADHYHHDGMSQYTAVYYFFVANVVLVFPMVCYLIGQANFDETRSQTTTTNDVSQSQGAAMKKHALGMLKNLDNIVFLITVVISGIAMAVYIYFTLLLIKDVIPSLPKSKRSLVLVSGSVANMVMFPFTQPLINLLGGPTQGIIVALSAYFVRYMIMSFTSSLPVMLSVNLLHGFCFALAWTSMMEHLHKLVTEEIKLTMFMLLSAIHFGVCGLITNIAGGKLYDTYGGPALFRGVAILCAVWVIFMVIYNTAKHTKKKRETTPSKKDIDNSNTDSNKSANDLERNNGIGKENLALDRT